MTAKTTLALAAVALATLAAPALAAAQTSPTDKRKIARLETQVRALSARANRLEGQLQTATQQLARSTDFALCGYADSWDGIYAAWWGVDAIFNAFTGRRLFGPRAAIDDQGACQRLGVTRTPWRDPGMLRALAATDDLPRSGRRALNP